MGLKILQMHCYYQEQSNSMLSFQTMTWNEGIGYQWGKMVISGEVLSLATPPCVNMGKFWLWVSRLLENAFGTIVSDTMVSDTMGL